MIAVVVTLAVVLTRKKDEDNDSKEKNGESYITPTTISNTDEKLQNMIKHVFYYNY